MAKKDVCAVCSKLLKEKIIPYEGKKFCCEVCCRKYKNGEKAKKVCEFC